MCGAICRRRYDYAAGSVAQSSAAQSGNVGERAPIQHPGLYPAHRTPRPRTALSSLAIAPTAAAAAAAAAGEAGGLRTVMQHLPRAVGHLAIARLAPVLACGRPMRAPTSGGGRPGAGRRAPKGGAGAHRPGDRGRWLPRCQRPPAQTPPRLFVSLQLLPRPSVWLPRRPPPPWPPPPPPSLQLPRALRQRPVSRQRPSARPPRSGLALPPP